MQRGCNLPLYGDFAYSLAALGPSLDQFKAYAKVSNEQSERLLTIRGLFRLKSAAEDGRTPVPIEEVRKGSADYALMFEWFDRVGYNADIPGNSKESGITPTTFPDWAGRTAWS